MVVGLASTVMAADAAQEKANKEQQLREELEGLNRDLAKAEIAAQKQALIATKRRDEARAEAENTRQLLTLLVSVLSKARVNPKTGEEFTVKEALDDFSKNVETLFADNIEQPPALKRQTAAEVHLALGRSFFSAGVPARAAQHFERALGDGAEKPGDGRMSPARRASSEGRSIGWRRHWRFIGTAAPNHEWLRAGP